MERLMNLAPKAIFLSYLIKMIVLSPTITDVGVISALAILAGIQIYTDKNKTVQEIKENCKHQIKAVKEESKKDLDEVKAVINKQNEVINLQAIEFSKLRNDMSGIKLKNDFKSIEGFGKKVG